MGTRGRYLILVGLLVLALLVAGCKGRKAIPDLPDENEILLLEAEGNAAATDTPAEAPAVSASTVVTATAEQPAVTTAPQTEQGGETADTTQPTATEAAAPEVAATPEVIATVGAETTPAVTAAGVRTHVVQPGQNLFRIAMMYGTSVEALAAANNITNPALISVGQELAIPTGSATAPEAPPQTTTGNTYVVQSGDNLFRIALRYGVDQYYLARYNGIANPAQIYVGQVIRIP